MRTIPLTQGKIAIVDDEDFDRVSQFKWFAWKHEKKYYARRTIAREGKWITVWMHRYVLGVCGKQLTDHINGDGLDNRRANLRIANSSENARNRRGCSESGFKGVHKSGQKKNPWRSAIMVNGKLIYIGVFSAALDAAKAYNAKAIECFGKFAWINHI